MSSYFCDINLCNGLEVTMNRPSSIPKSVIPYELDFDAETSFTQSKEYHCGNQEEGPHLTLEDPPFYS